MNFNFNDSNIIVGYIKELLHNFNLPVVPVYTDDTQPYNGRTYIKDYSFYSFSDGKLKLSIPYLYGRQYLNLTDNFKIKTNIYDSDTHEYLGNYLRFIRDYNKINLMPLYNCFSNRILKNVNEVFTLKSKTVVNDGVTINEPRGYYINTNSVKDVYYILPVKFNKEYTIALDCNKQFDIFCILYKNGIINQVGRSSVNGVTLSYEKLINDTLINMPGSSFSNPFIYKVNYDASDLWDMESCLYMVIKLPTSISTSIVVLEGNYLDISKPICNNISALNYNSNGDILIPKNYAGDLLPTKLSLLFNNNEISYPFSDRLVEYLLLNAITSKEKIEHNIERIQTDLVNQGAKANGFINDIWTDKIKEAIYKFIATSKPKYKDTLTVTINGEDEIKYNSNLLDNFDDILGYADKDVEFQLQTYRG